MTTEQKAKAYDRALERAMELYENSNGMILKKWLWKVFPELAEQSDERTRKALLHLVNSNKELSFGIDNYDGVKWEDIITWLEKKVCQKSVDKEYTFKSIPRLLDMIEPTDRAKSYCKKLIDSLQTEGYSVDAKIVGECLKQMNGEKVAMAVMDTEKQDEQKSQRMVSAEAKEALYDKPTDEEMKELLRTEYEKGRADTIAEMEKDWSEKDEKVIAIINNALTESNTPPDDYDKVYDWLESLRKRIGE